MRTEDCNCIHHDHAEALRTPTVIFKVEARGRPPGEKRSKKWVRIFTKASEVEPCRKLWEKHAFLEVTVSSTETDWVEERE